MSSEYRRNHYVPVWYQKRFIPPGTKDAKLFYLDLRPGSFTDPRGVSHGRKALHRKGPKHCFYQDNLYTTRFGSAESTDIERLFFGAIDSNGRDAVDHFSKFEHASAFHDAFEDLMIYMSTQKLRTPKGLSWLGKQAKSNDHQVVLKTMVNYKQLFCALWTECIWLIADASRVDTKFIVSDHPVTVYNRECGPRWCQRNGDPDIWLNGTHTIFPVSLDKLLILTNLSWVRNPYQSAVKSRPNPNPLRNAIFSIMDVQIERHLTEQEVREINFIIKASALRYIAAWKEDWLYPEKHVTKSDWARYGHGYLLMPDPRSVAFKGELLMGFKDGTSTGFDEYGRRPWDPEYRQRSTGKHGEWEMSQKFQGEFARLFGPYRRGRSFQFDRLDPEKDSDDFHNYHLNLDKRIKT